MVKLDFSQDKLMNNHILKLISFKIKKQVITYSKNFNHHKIHLEKVIKKILYFYKIRVNILIKLKKNKF